MNNKRRRQPMEQKQVDATVELRVIQPEQQSAPVQSQTPRRKVFNAPPCHMCEGDRNKDPEAKGKNYSRVKSAPQGLRYCECDYCGHTWKVSIPT